jgi:glycosyltransferase involved in cell wall biosynthesis
MKILQVNKFHYPRGGADIYFLNLTASLQAAGQEVAVFCMDHPKNLPSPWQKYFVSHLSFNAGGLKNKLKTPGRVLYSLEAKRKFTKLVKDFQPDIIHIHNIYHHLSPSILTVAKKYHIPMVMHLHDYKLICANHSLFTAGQTCKRCHPNKYYQCLLHRCIKGSLAGSGLAALEMYLHHSILKIYENNIDLFIAPSRFMKDLVVRYGWPANKLIVLNNPYSSDLKNNDNSKNTVLTGDYLLYFGRLSPEKGITTLIQAAASGGYKTKIVGDGPDKDKLIKQAQQLQAPVEFIDFQAPEQLLPLIKQAQAIVIPSIWAENMPLTLLEALSLGKIVIASRIGGLPEIIKDGENGLLFTPGDANDLVKKIANLSNLNPEQVALAAQKTVENFSPAKHCQAILNIYQDVLSSTTVKGQK